MITGIFLDTIRQQWKELLSYWSAFYLYRLIHNVVILVQVPPFSSQADKLFYFHSLVINSLIQKS